MHGSMPHARLAIAAALLAGTATAALAQSPSYESRGYGGPLYVGPNFQAGGQHSPPVYDSKPSRSEHTRKRVYKAPSRHAQPEPEKTETAKAPAKAKPESEAEAEAITENSSIAAASAPKPKVETATTSSGPQNENSTIARVAGDNTKNAGNSGTSSAPQPKTATQNVGCKKYFPTSGMTLSVPCE